MSHSLTDRTIDLQAIQGIWSRIYLKSGTFTDSTTQVRWMQSNDKHVDLRLSASFLSIPAKALCHLTEVELREVASVEAFAGTTCVIPSADHSRSQCTWTREINYQGPQNAPDVGDLYWSADTLMEEGVYADYSEAWMAYAMGPGSASATSADFRDEHGFRLFLCTMGDTFAMARSNPESMQAQNSLVEQVNAALATRDELLLYQLFDQEFCFGELDQQNAVIVHSSNPSRVGKVAFTLHTRLEDLQALDVSQESFTGETTFKHFSRCR